MKKKENIIIPRAGHYKSVLSNSRDILLRSGAKVCICVCVHCKAIPTKDLANTTEVVSR
jgi:hypothetical protein